MSLNDIAEAISIPKSTVSSYEEGRAKPKEDTLKKLAVLFKVTPEELMFKNLERTPKLPNGNKNHTHTDKSRSNQNGATTYSGKGKSISMDDIFALPLLELLRLQQESDDAEMKVMATHIISLKKEIAALERENQILRENIQDLRQK